jgi:hypothetical protein
MDLVTNGKGARFDIRYGLNVPLQCYNTANTPHNPSRQIVVK